MMWDNVLLAIKLGSLTLVASSGAGYIALFLVERFVMGIG